jgi:hypothetical protein
LGCSLPVDLPQRSLLSLATVMTDLPLPVLQPRNRSSPLGH